MKRMLIVLALCLFSGSLLAGPSIGILGGVNLANFTGDDVEDNSTKVCIGGGAFAEMPFSPVMAVRAELLYMNKGAEWDQYDDAGVRLSYFDVPVLMKFSLPVNTVISPNLFVGPYVSFNLSAESYMGDVETDVKDNIKSTDYGVVIGGGLDYPMGQGELTFDVRYSLGLTKIDDMEGNDEEDDVKNTGIMFMLGYGFGL